MKISNPPSRVLSKPISLSCSCPWQWQVAVLALALFGQLLVFLRQVWSLGLLWVAEASACRECLLAQVLVSPWYQDPLAQWASAWRQEALAKVVALPWLPSLVELLVLWLLALPLVDQSLAWLAAASVAALALAALLSFFCLCYLPQLWSRLPWQDQEAHVAFFWPA